jgi:hypothetical protein
MVAAAWPVFGQSVPASGSTSDVPPAVATVALSRTEQERFMETAAVTAVKRAGKGITGTQRATLSAGAITHDVSIQTIDVSKTQFQSARGVELGFRDYWGFNVAAHRLAVMLGLDMVPPSVAREFRRQDAAFTWWVDDVLFDEQERLEQKQRPPDAAQWTAQIHILRVFDELIANTDRNRGNMLIDKRWKVWLIDHTRAFRTAHTLQEPKTIVRCEKALLEGMKALSLTSMMAQLGDYLTRTQVEAVLKRRDLLVSRIESLGSGALYERARH